MHDNFSSHLQLSYDLLDLRILLYPFTNLQHVQHYESGLEQFEMSHFVLLDGFNELRQQTMADDFSSNIAHFELLEILAIKTMVFKKFKH